MEQNGVQYEVRIDDGLLLVLVFVFLSLYEAIAFERSERLDFYCVFFLLKSIR